MDDDIDLRDIFRVLWKNRFLILGIFLIAVVVAGVVSVAMPSVYRSSCIVALGNFGDPIYTDRYIAEEFLLSDELLLEVIDQLNLDVPPEKLKGFRDGIKIESVSDTVLKISIETKDRQNATEILQKMVSIILNHSEGSYNKYREMTSDKLLITQKHMIVLEEDINQTREVLKNIEKSSEISQEVLELRYSRTLEYLQNENSRYASLLAQYFDLKKQLDFMDNTRVIVVSEDPI